MSILISSEGYEIHIDNKHPLLKNPIISQFDINTELPIPFEHLQLMINGVDDVTRDKKFILEHIELLKKLVLENHIKQYLLKYYNFFNNLNDDIYQYLTIYDMHLLDEKYIHDFLNQRFNYASQEEKDKILKIKRIKDIILIGTHYIIDVQRNVENNIKNKNDYESIVGDEIITIPYVIKLFLKYYLFKIVQYASDDIKNNFKFIKFACSIDGRVLKYASGELKNNFEIVEIACSNYGSVLEYASLELKNNFEIVKIACSKHGTALEHAHPILKNDFKIVEIACSQHGMALKYASYELKNNFEIVKIACSQDGRALKYASGNLKNNYKIVKIACSENGNALRHASDELKNNFKIVETACYRDGYVLEHASEKLMNNPELIEIREAYIYEMLNSRYNYM